MLIIKTVEVSVAQRTVTYYKNKGYDIPTAYNEKSKREVYNFGEKFLVNVEDLPNSSHTKIKYKCDCCKKIFVTMYCDWKNAKYPELGDLCRDCAAKIKLPKIMQEKYGEDNSSKVATIIDKKKQTNLARYGNEWAIASSAVRDIIKASYIDKYGVDNPMKNDEVKQRAINTNNIRYGGNSALCDEDVKAKSRKTCLEKYGVENAFQCKEIQNKARASMCANGNAPTSKAERKLYPTLKEMYGEDNCIPAYSVGNLSLDYLLVVDDINIDVEYDGYYWHKNRGKKDAARNAVLMNMGYRVIRIKANNQDILPTKEQIANAVDYLVKGNHRLTFIDMNN